MHFKGLKQIFKRGLIPAAILLLTAAVTSCSSTDDIEEAPGFDWIPYGNYIISFKIDTGDDDSKSRSLDNPNARDLSQNGELVFGYPDEHALASDGNYAIFIRQGRVYDVQKLQLNHERLSNPEEDDIEFETYYSATIKLNDVDVDEIETSLPMSCFIIVNGNPLSDKILSLKNKEPNEVLKLIWDSYNSPEKLGIYENNDTTFFTMSNTIYLDKDNNLKTDVDITRSNIYTDPLKPGKLVRVQVERMVGKFSFEINAAPLNGSYDKENHIFKSKSNEIVYCTGFEEDPLSKEWLPVNELRHWQAKLIGWGMNAFEQEANVFKNFKKTETYFTGWNDPANYRTYWAEDLNYDSGNYPIQYRRAVNLNRKSYGDLETTQENTLKNFSYQELLGTFDNLIVYTPENTYDWKKLTDKEYDNRLNVVAGTHLIVTAELETDIDPQNPKNDNAPFKASDLYRDRTGVFYSNIKDCFWTMVRNLNLQLHTQIIMEFMDYDWNTTTNIDGSNKRFTLTHNKNFKLFLGDTELTHDYIYNVLTEKQVRSFFVPATVKDGDGKVIIWNDDFKIQDTEDGSQFKVSTKISTIFNESTGKTEYVRENERDADKNDLKSIIYEWAGSLDHFNNGKMYYYAPVTLGDIKDTNNKNICGVVRNNWYRYSLSDVRKIGTPVDNPTEPIIPNTVLTNDQVNITVQIIDWCARDIYTPIL